MFYNFRKCAKSMLMLGTHNSICEYWWCITIITKVCVCVCVYIYIYLVTKSKQWLHIIIDMETWKLNVQGRGILVIELPNNNNTCGCVHCNLPNTCYVKRTYLTYVLENNWKMTRLNLYVLNYDKIWL